MYARMYVCVCVSRGTCSVGAGPSTSDTLMPPPPPPLRTLTLLSSPLV